MSFSTETLGNLIKFATSNRAGNRDFPILSMTMHEGLVDQSSKFKKRVASDDTSAYKVVRRGQLVVGFPIDEGVLSFQNLYDEAIVSPAYDIWDVAQGDAIDRSYLQRFLRSPHALTFYRGNLRSTTARRRTIPRDTFLGLEVPIPTLNEQKRIAAIIDQADELRRQRQRVLELLNQLGRAIFYEMFGDPTTNPRGLQRVALGELANFYSGNSLPDGKPYEGQADGHLLLKVSDLNHEQNQQDIVCAAAWSPLPGSRAGTCPPNSLIFPKRGGAIGTNKKRWLRRSAILDPNLMGVHPHEGKLTMPFLNGWFQTFNLSDIASGSSVPQLNKQDLAPLEIPLPSVEEQTDYAERMDVLSATRRSCAKALGLDHQLFTSLQHRAFRGEL